MTVDSMAELSSPVSGRAFPPIRGDRRSQVLAQALVGALLVGLTLIGSFAIGATGQGLAIIVGTLTAIIAIVMFFQPAVGAYLLIAFVYLNLSDVAKAAVGIPSLIRPLIIFMLISVLANRVLIQRKPIIFRGLEFSVLIYGLVTLLSATVAKDQAVASDQLSEWIKNFAILLILVQLCSQEKVF